MEIKRLFNPITIADIQQLEEKLEFKLPEDYASFLLKYNGGIPSPNIFLISKREKEDIISIFFGITENKDCDVWKNYALSLGDIPRDVLPIGEDPGGSFIYLGISQENKGIVFFGDHESNNVIAIADSLDSFLNGLYTKLKY